MAVEAGVGSAGAGTGRGSKLVVGLLWQLAQLVLVLWIISTLLFFLIRLTGDPADLLAGQNASPATVQSIRERFGLNDPLPVQYGRLSGEPCSSILVAR